MKNCYGWKRWNRLERKWRHSSSNIFFISLLFCFEEKNGMTRETVRCFIRFSRKIFSLVELKIELNTLLASLTTMKVHFSSRQITHSFDESRWKFFIEKRIDEDENICQLVQAETNDRSTNLQQFQDQITPLCLVQYEIELIFVRHRSVILLCHRQSFSMLKREKERRRLWTISSQQWEESFRHVSNI